MRWRSLGAGLVLSILLCVAGESRADIISRNNPYRSFNISGINYGSMQWERQHRAQQSHSTSYYSSSRRILPWRR